jgi:hypothetical protein
MQYEKVERDFVHRTLKIIKQYDEYIGTLPLKGAGPKEFRDTLLINCLTGLIVFPVEHRWRGKSLKQRKLTPICKGDETIYLKDIRKDWGLAEINIEKLYDFENNSIDPEDATLRLLLYRIRNSVAHTRVETLDEIAPTIFQPYADENQEPGVQVQYGDSPDQPGESQIKALVFKDARKDNGSWITTFKASIPLDGLRVFSTRFAKKYLEDWFNVQFTDGFETWMKKPLIA